jgi:hypothetical protein
MLAHHCEAQTNNDANENSDEEIFVAVEEMNLVNTLGDRMPRA